jgi:hypothetical protein
MILRWLRPAALVGTARALLRDTRGTEAVELAIVIFPFLYVLLVIIQMGLYYMTQSALDAGVNTEVPITDGTVETPTASPASVPIVLRAQSKVVVLAPGFSLSTVQSAAILRFGAF